MDISFEYAVKGEAKSGEIIIIKRGFRSRNDAEDHPIKWSGWKRVWVDAVSCFSPKEEKPVARKCLHCKAQFLSEHSGNRLCLNCTGLSKAGGMDTGNFNERSRVNPRGLNR